MDGVMDGMEWMGWDEKSELLNTCIILYYIISFIYQIDKYHSFINIMHHIIHSFIILFIPIHSFLFIHLVAEGSVSSSTGMFGWAAGTCISFHPTVDHLFVIGTEEGYVHQCSKTYHNEYLGTLTGHQMSVYAVKYNPFSGKVVLTAGADWTVRLWDMSTIANNGGGSAAAPAQQKSVLSFDLNSPVGDIAWAPYSSTIFAACTAEGKVIIIHEMKRFKDDLNM